MRLDGVGGPSEYQRLIEGASPVELGEGVDEATLAGLFYTGGTTGQSKGVMLTHRNLVANTFHQQQATPLHSDDVFLVIGAAVPRGGSTSVLQCLAQGTHQVVAPEFDPAVALDLVERYGGHVTLVVPTMMAAMLEVQAARPRDVTSVRLIGHGGSPIAFELVRRATKAFPDAELVHLYGATETAPILTALHHEERMIDGPRARVVRPAGARGRGGGGRGRRRAAPRGEVGEVVRRGANVMAGYWNKPEETAAALRRGWYHTGDLGLLDDEGYLFLVDRAKDMIVSGGRMSTAPRSRTPCTPIRWCSRRRSSASPTTSGARRSTPSSCPGAR